MSPTTALCFIVLAAGFVLAQTSLRTHRSAVLGVTGLLVAAVGATCCDRRGLGNQRRVCVGQPDARCSSHGGWLPGAGDRHRHRGLGSDSTRVRRARVGPHRRQLSGCDGQSRIVAGVFGQEPNQDGLVIQPDVVGRTAERDRVWRGGSPGFEGAFAARSPANRESTGWKTRWWSAGGRRMRRTRRIEPRASSWRT